MNTRTLIAAAACASLLMALASCGGKDKKQTDADAEDAIDDGEESDLDTDPVDDPTPDPVDDPTPDPVDDPTPDPVDDPTTDPGEDPADDGEEDPTADATADAEDDAGEDAGMDASVDAGDDADDDTTGDVTTDGGSSPMLFFSEYVEGTSDNKAVEIYNAGSSGYDISLCSVRLYMNASTTVDYTITLSSVTLAADDVHVLCHTGFTSTGTSPCDQTSGSLEFNGNDAVELFCDGTVMDVIGRIGENPGTSGWGTGMTATANHTLRRKCTVTSGDTNGSDAFDPSVEWDGFSVDTFTGLGDHCP